MALFSRWVRCEETSITGPEGIDRRYYEFCAMAELKNALRSGDVSVVGSRQFRAFEDYLMSRPEFDRGLKEKTLPAAVPTTAAGLNKGEARNALATAVFFKRLGEIRDRSFENQQYRASGLNLVVAAITLYH